MIVWGCSTLPFFKNAAFGLAFVWERFLGIWGEAFKKTALLWLAICFEGSFHFGGGGRTVENVE